MATLNGRQFRSISASFTRPTDTVAYNAGDIVANSTTTSVTTLSWSTSGSRPFVVSRIRFHKSAASVTNAQFRIHLYSVAPTVGTAGDNATYANVVGSANWLGSFDGTMAATHSDGAAINCLPTGNSPRRDYIGDPGTVYGLVEALAAYTPASGEVFTATLVSEFDQ